MSVRHPIVPARTGAAALLTAALSLTLGGLAAIAFAMPAADVGPTPTGKAQIAPVPPGFSRHAGPAEPHPAPPSTEPTASLARPISSAAWTDEHRSWKVTVDRRPCLRMSASVGPASARAPQAGSDDSGLPRSRSFRSALLAHRHARADCTPARPSAGRPSCRLPLDSFVR